jgi:hypothetical protein
MFVQPNQHNPRKLRPRFCQVKSVQPKSHDSNILMTAYNNARCEMAKIVKAYEYKKYIKNVIPLPDKLFRFTKINPKTLPSSVLRLHHYRCIVIAGLCNG